MKYYYFIWSDKNREYIKKEITSNEAYITLSHYYRTSFVKKLQGKLFRLRTKFGWIETEAENGIVPAPNFYGVCE